MAWDLALVVPLVFIAAALYTSVGHGGATAYLTILTLAGWAVPRLVTTVLVLNVLAAGIAFVAFRRAGHLRPQLLWPFLIASIPMAFIGGLAPFSGRVQALLLGVVLLLAALRLLFLSQPPVRRLRRDGAAFFAGAPLIGAVLGFLAGATGIGGGIFLSPILLFAGWANVREAASVASAFIVLNSLAGLAAKVGRQPLDAEILLPLAGAVVAGALIGAALGARHLHPRALQVLLGAVLLVAGTKALVGV